MFSCAPSLSQHASGSGVCPYVCFVSPADKQGCRFAVLLNLRYIISRANVNRAAKEQLIGVCYQKLFIGNRFLLLLSQMQ